MKNNRPVAPTLAGSRKPARARPEIAPLFRVAAVLALGSLTACQPTPNQIDQHLMTVTTSPIPGATAKVVPAAPMQSNAPPAKFCVTDAGYCPLPAPAGAGQYCICQTGSLMYGGKTNAAPTTYKAPLFGQ